MGVRDSYSTTRQTLEVPEWMQGMPQEMVTNVMDLLEQPMLSAEDQVAGLQGQHIDASNQLEAFANGQGAENANAVTQAGLGAIGGVGMGQDILAGVAGQGPAMNRGVDMDRVGSYIDNDILGGQIDAASRDVVRNFNEVDAPASRMMQALSGGTGSTRGAVGDAILQRGAMDRVGDISSGMRGQAFRQALGIGANEAAQNAGLENAGLDRGITAGNSLINSGMAGADMIGQGQQMSLGNFGALAASGDIQRAYEQSIKDANQNNYLQGWRNQGMASGMINDSSNLYGTHESRTKNTISTHQWLSEINDAVAQWQGSMAGSDKRLKKNIEYAETHNGHKFYNFTWRSNGKPGFGVIAQEVQKTHPELVEECCGALVVDYGGLYS